MEELRDASIHHTALKVFGDIKSMKLYENLYETVQRLVCSPNVDKHNMKNTLEMVIKANGLETEIRDIVYHQIRSSVKTELRNTIASVGRPDARVYIYDNIPDSDRSRRTIR